MGGGKGKGMAHACWLGLNRSLVLVPMLDTTAEFTYESISASKTTFVILMTSLEMG